MRKATRNGQQSAIKSAGQLFAGPSLARVAIVTSLTENPHSWTVSKKPDDSKLPAFAGDLIV
jgi:hypothetical protein